MRFGYDSRTGSTLLAESVMCLQLQRVATKILQTLLLLVCERFLLLRRQITTGGVLGRGPDGTAAPLHLCSARFELAEVVAPSFVEETGFPRRHFDVASKLRPDEAVPECPLLNGQKLRVTAEQPTVEAQHCLCPSLGTKRHRIFSLLVHQATWVRKAVHDAARNGRQSWIDASTGAPQHGLRENRQQGEPVDALGQKKMR